MNSQTTITYVVAESSHRYSVGSTVVSLSVKGDPTECAEMADAVYGGFTQTANSPLTSTLAHILNDTDSAHELCARH